MMQHILKGSSEQGRVQAFCAVKRFLASCSRTRFLAVGRCERLAESRSCKSEILSSVAAEAVHAA